MAAAAWRSNSSVCNAVCSSETYPPIGLHRSRMKLYDVLSNRHRLNLSPKRLLFSFEVQQLRFHASCRQPVRNRVHDIGDLPVNAGKPLFDVPAPLPIDGIQPLLLGMIFSKKTCNGVRCKQALLNSFKCTLFKLGNSDRSVVGAGAFLTVGGAGKLVAVLHGVGSATTTAAHKSREHVLRPPPMMESYAAIEFLTGLHGIPEFVVDDAQMGNLHDLFGSETKRSQSAHAKGAVAA